MLAIRAYVFTIYTVPDTSLQPTLYKGDRVMVNRLERVRLQRGDIVVYQDGHDEFIGRITAVPGDTITLSGQTYQIPLRCLCSTCTCHSCNIYFVSQNGLLSLITHDAIIGRPFRLFPFRR